jgi:predicted nucleic acid-binding protein
MILDTTVLVDLQRELRRGHAGPASRFLATSGETPLFISFVSVMEFAEGFPDDARDACERFLAPFRVLWPDPDTGWIAARISRTVGAAGRPIGDHDVWIAALALQHDRTVVSRNQEHFRRVPGLSYRGY